MTATDTVTDVRLERDALLQALATVMPATAPRGTSLPVLAGVRIGAGEGRLEVTATDCELEISTSVKGGGDDRFEAVVPARILHRLVKQAKAGAVSLHRVDDAWFDIAWGRTKAKLRALPLDEFPRTHQVEGHEFKMSAEDLRRAGRLVPFASTDDARPILTGVSLGPTEGVTTDSYRLATAQWTEPLALPDSVDQLLVPARAIAHLPKTLLDTEQATVTTDDRMIQFDVAEITMRTRLVQGNFPPYERLIPQTPGTAITVARAELIDAVKTAGALGGEDSGTAVRLRITDDDELSVSIEIQDVGQVESSVAANVDGPTVAAAFSMPYLLSILDAAQGDQVTLQIQDALKPVLVREDPYIFLIMPVRMS